ncbi:glycosyltransferase [Oleidesulfovibrio sp.]|uniref:glycosyltransferase n=1 Tax=Oleidesulfovibrio sp. TaxID=2909707 RepID=UPI003A883D54
MKILFVHPNFPAQFRHIAAALGKAKDPSHQVIFLTSTPRKEWTIPGVKKAVYSPLQDDTPSSIHPLVSHFDARGRAGAAVYSACNTLRKQGFVPDVIVAHSGWGSSYFLRDVFPESRLLAFFEWYYNTSGADVGFDPAEPVSDIMRMTLRTRNATILNDIAECDWGYAPTLWQARQFPAMARSKMCVVHDGIDTGYFAPAADRKEVAAGLAQELGIDYTPRTRLVTWVGRGMEPYRGFPQVMEALPAILDSDPDVHVLMVGEDRVCYGRPPEDGRSWKQVMLEHISPLMSGGEPVERRVHFTGALPYVSYRRVLQASDAHIYLTRPFVLSWSMLEAMSCGALMVCSDTAPVQEVIQNGRNGLLTDFFSPVQLAKNVCEALASGREADALRAAARDTVLKSYDLRKMLSAQLRIINNLAEGKSAMAGLLPQIKK